FLEHCFLDPMGFRLGQAFAEVEVARHHELRHPLLAKAEQFRGRNAMPRAQHTATITSSSPSSDGTPKAPDSSTAGCWLTIFSTSKDEIFSPRRRIESVLRSAKK